MSRLPREPKENLPARAKPHINRSGCDQISPLGLALQRLQTIASRRIRLRYIQLTNMMPKLWPRRYTINSGFDGPWTPTDHQLFFTQLESAYVDEKSLQKRIEMIDRHCTG